jgi:hypothetical protein
MVGYKSKERLCQMTTENKLNIKVAVLQASLAAIHYHAKRLDKLLPDKLLQAKCIIISICVECERCLPKLKNIKPLKTTYAKRSRVN